MQSDPIRGNTIRWTFDDGPTAGTSFEHVFSDDGSVAYKMAGSDKLTREKHYECAAITDRVHSVSYLASSGWTLTAILDFDSSGVVAYASNGKQLVIQHGHFDATRKPS